LDVSLRIASERDREFLYNLHCRTMRMVIEQTWGWDEAWQRAEFDRRFCEHAVSIIECDGADAGAIVLEWKADSVYIHEFQVLPEYQGRGIGSAVLRRVIGQAGSRGLAVTLSVLRANPRAQQLYERLGFRVTDVEEPFRHMRYA
jgi:GNAT superfamily N-acetyltransferase